MPTALFRITDTLGDIAEQFREKALNIGALIANTQLEEAAVSAGAKMSL
jgi:hypothetical protein